MPQGYTETRWSQRYRPRTVRSREAVYTEQFPSFSLHLKWHDVYKWSLKMHFFHSGIVINVNKCRKHCTEKIWRHYFKGSTGFIQLAANPTLRGHVLFPKSIHNLFSFWQTDLNVKENDKRQEKLKILMFEKHVDLNDEWLEQLTDKQTDHSVNFLFLRGRSSCGAVVLHGWINVCILGFSQHILWDAEQWVSYKRGAGGCFTSH